MRIAGVDEAGRGPLAGPVVAAAVIFPPNYSHVDITDSKKLSKKKRERLYDEIIEDALDYAICAVGPRRIEHLNIREATRFAMAHCIERVHPDHARIDGNMLVDTSISQEAIVKGDQKFVDIAAASILAKVYRDRLMKILDSYYPGYGLSGHAGYPTRSHKESLLSQGASPAHRLTFRGVRESIPQSSTFIRSRAQHLHRLGMLELPLA